MESDRKEESSSRNPTQHNEDGTNKDGNARHSSEGDAIQVLQCTDSFFVADTVEDDDSLMIPPTPDMIIPSTQEFTYEDEKNTTVLSVDETCTEDLSKPGQDIIVLEEEDPANDMTQDIPELDEETQQLLPKKTSVEKVPDDLDDDDDWQLKFTETQETQELLSISRMREAKEKEISQSSTGDSTENKDTSVEEPSPKKQISSKLDESGQICDKPSDKSPAKGGDDVPVLDVDSEDEIEPSQSCLIDYQKSSTYSAFRDEMLQSSLSVRGSASSTPESQRSGKTNKPALDKNTDILSISSPPESATKLSSPSSNSKDDQTKDPLQIIDIVSGNELSEPKPVADSDIMEITASGTVVEEPLTKVDTWVVGKKDISAKETVSSEVECSKSTAIPSPKKTKSTLMSQNVKDIVTVELDSSKDITISDLDDPKDITMSDLGDPKDSTTPDRKNSSKDITVSDLSDPKDITMSDLGDPKDSVSPNRKDRTLPDLEGSKDRTVSDFGDHKSDPDHSKDESVLNPAEQENITVEQKDNLKGVFSHNVETTPDASKLNQEKTTPVIISSDNHFKSINSELSFECASVAATSTPCEGKDTVVTSKPQELKIVLTESKPTVTPNKESDKSNNASDENGRVDYDTPKGLQSIKMVEPAPQSLKSILHQTSRLSRNKQKVQFQNEKESDKYIKLLGSFKDTRSLKKIFSSAGLNLEKKHSEAILNLKSKEEFKLSKVFTITVKENNVYLEESLQLEYPGMNLAASPHSSSGSGSLTVTSSSISTVSLHSGEMADIDSEHTSKSTSSSSIQLDNTGQSVPSQEEKTSTQKSEPSSFSTYFAAKKEPGEESETKTEPAISPIASTSKAQKKTSARGRKRTVLSSSSSTSEVKNTRKRGRYVKQVSETETARATSPDSLSSYIEVPKTTRGGRRRTSDKKPEAEPDLKIEVQEISPEQEVNDGSPVGNIIPGVRVMARWTDGFYYPGVVQSQAKEDRWSVCFDDGTVKAINHESLIKASFIQPGTSILVQNPDGYFDSGIVVTPFREGQNYGYEIELDNGITKRYPRKSVVFSSDQAKLIMSSRPPTTPATMTINLDNIVDGKRKRKSLQAPETTPPTKKSSRTTRRELLKPDPRVDTSEGPAVCPTEASSAEEPESSKSNQRPTRKRKAAITAVKMTKLSNQKKAPKLFKDYAFMLTNTERKPVPKPDVTSSSCESLTEEDEEVKPFDKEELMAYIISRGGTVLDKFDDVKKCSKPHVFLLANTYLRTMKYIQCLAAGIPCIKHHWVQNCCFEGEIQCEKNYILPAGFSIVSNEVIEWHGKTDILKDKKISLVSAPGNSFVENWMPVLLASKVDHVQKTFPTSKSGSSANVDLIITNSVCPQDIIQAARRKKIPVVSIEWLIQTLIAGECLPYDAHPKFKHDYTE